MYIGLFVELYNLPDDTEPAGAAELVKRLLVTVFNPEYSSDIQVDIKEQL